MSTYAYLTCRETRKSLWLGKCLRRKNADGLLVPCGFHIGQPEDAQNEILDRALRRFLAEHMGKELVVLTDAPSEPFDVAELDEVTESITLEEYANDWPLPGLDGEFPSSEPE